MFFSTWQKWRRRSARNKKRKQVPYFRKCFLEVLEDRTLLSANIYHVTLGGDANTADPNDPTGLSGTIRYCINQANIPTNAGSTIDFNLKDIGNTITLTHGELEISNTMKIDNLPNGTAKTPAASTLSINGTSSTGVASRVFNITSQGAVVTIAGLTITGGNASPLLSGTPGNQGGDIFNGGTLSLQDDVVEDGLSQGNIGGPTGRGGGIFNAEGQNGLGSGAKLTLDNTIVENNVAKGVPVGIAPVARTIGGSGIGGGIYNDINATVIVSNGSQVIYNQALGSSNAFFNLNGPNGGNNQLGWHGQDGGSAEGGGIASKGSLVFNGTSTNPLVISNNVAKGGDGGNGGNAGNATKAKIGGLAIRGGAGGDGGAAMGGGVYSTGSAFSVNYVQFIGNQALSGNGGDGGKGGNAKTSAPGGPGGKGGDTGVAQGGGLFNTGGAVSVTGGSFSANSAGTGNQAVSGSGGNGGAGGNAGKAGNKLSYAGGDGGHGGNPGLAQGGDAYNASTQGGGMTFTSITTTAALAQGGLGGFGGAGGLGGNSGLTTAPGGVGGFGGHGGIGGSAQGGGIYNQSGNLSFSKFSSTNSQAKGGDGNYGGNAATGGNGTASYVPGGHGGLGGPGGAGGAGQGGGFFNVGGTLTLSNSQFTSDPTTKRANIATSGDGGNGGNGGVGGIGGKYAEGGNGGHAGVGGNAGIAEGGAGVNGGGDATISGSTFTNNQVQSGSGGNGGDGGDGGHYGPSGFLWGSEADGGNGGSGSTARGGALSVTKGSLDISASTFGGSAALANQVIGNSGGKGGEGGQIGIGLNGITGVTGKGGRGGDGTTVSGGAVSVTGTAKPSINMLSSFSGIDSLNSFNSEPPDTQGAAGPSNYIETVNQAITISNKSTGGTISTDSLSDFFFTQGGLNHVSSFDFQSDSFVTYDPLAKCFIVGDLEIALDTNTGLPDKNGEANALLLAVSRTDDPTNLTSSDWYFSEVNTTLPNVAIQDYPGNVGYNADALVITQNSFSATADIGTFVNSISMSALTSGQTLISGKNFFQNEYTPTQLPLLPRPVTMKDAKPGDPMWFVASAGDGGQDIVGAANTIDVLKMTNLLSANPTFTTTKLKVNPYYENVPPEQPDASVISNAIDSRILNADESNGLIVAAQNISNAAGNQDISRWYLIDVSSGTPTLQQQGNVTGGPGVYDVVPGIAINAAGDIGMSYIQSGTAAGQFMSMYVTGRSPNDPVGTMATPILVQSGFGDANYTGSRNGDMSGINVDPSDGSFWAANEFANQELGYNWGTAIAHFAVLKNVLPARPVTIEGSSFDYNTISAGAGGNGGISGPLGGTCGAGGYGGSASGGGIALSATSAEDAKLSAVGISNNSAFAADGGVGAARATDDSGAGGNGGSVVGVGVSSINYNLAVTNAAINANVGTGGHGGKGGSSSLTVPSSSAGGKGGNGGSVVGGGIAFVNNLLSALSFSVTASAAQNNQLTGGLGGRGGDAGTTGHDHITGGAGGAGGAVLGGGISIEVAGVNSCTIKSVSLLGEKLNAGSGAPGGAGSSHKRTGNPTISALPGSYAAGGSGGDAQGGGLYNTSLNTTTPSTLTITGSTMSGNQLIAGNGAIGGTGTTPNGGPGGDGGQGGNAEGGGFYDGNNTTLTVVNTTLGGTNTASNPDLYSNTLASGSGGAGNDGGTPQGVLYSDGGNGGNAGNAEGGGAYVKSGSAAFVNDTIVNNQAMSIGLPGLPGAAGGNGQGIPGTRGLDGRGEGGGYYAAGGSNSIGNSIIDLNNAASGVVIKDSSFQGLNSSNGGGTAPDTQGAAGPTDYVETVNQAIAIYNKTNGSLLAADSLSDFWYTQGGLKHADAGSMLGNPIVVWDGQIQRFIIAEQDVDSSTGVSTFDIAVSKTASPTDMSNVNWNFFQVSTTETGFNADFSGSLGWNHDALVFTLNMLNTGTGADHVQIDSIDINALTNGTGLTEGGNAFQTDFANNGLLNLRPAVMHDAAANGPMWLVEEGGDNKSLNVVEMSNVLSANPTLTTTKLEFTPYYTAVAPLQPDGTAVTTNIDSSIQNAAEQNGLLVAAQTVSDQAGNDDKIQWYVIDVSGGTPALQQQGDVSGGANVYDAFPRIDINAQGLIGMTYLQSGTGAGQYLSTYVTGRVPTDPDGVMAAPILVQAGQANYTGGGEGNVSGISVDSNGSFWAANEYIDAAGNWGTAIAQFSLTTDTDVGGAFTSLGHNILGNLGNAVGFIGSDIIATAAQLDLGPLLNNGGPTLGGMGNTSPTLTDALLSSSLAIDAGDNGLISTYSTVFGPNPTDQRGPGFPREDVANSAVDVGAFEFDPPTIDSLNPNNAFEQGSTFVLKINGSGFEPGAIVTWTFAGSLSTYSSITLTPTPADITPTQITVTVPASALPDEGPVNVTVSNPDGSGVVGQVVTSAPATFTINEGTSLTLTGQGNQVSDENTTLSAANKNTVQITSSDPDTTFSATGLPTGLSIDPTTGVISGTIDPRAADAEEANNQPYQVTISGHDDGKVLGTYTFTWTVNDTTPPTLTPPSTTLNNTEGDKNVSVQIKAVDADPGTFTASNLPPGLTINKDTGEITGNIDKYGGGTYQVTVSASDNGHVGSTTFTWKVADVNAPTLTAPPTQNNKEGDKVSLQINATDADQFTAQNLPNGLTIDQTSGLISGTIAQPADGTHNVIITATDSDNSTANKSAQISFTWNVADNLPPTFTNPGTQTNNEGDKNISLQINAVDATSGTFTATGLPKGLSISGDGLISGNIDPYAAGTYTVTVSAADSDGGGTDSVHFQWVVKDVNPPKLVSPGDQHSSEGQQISLQLDVTDAESFSETGLPPGLSIDSNGLISGTITQPADGTHAVTITAYDTASDGTVLKTTINFNWTVDDNLPPALTAPTTQNNKEGDKVSLQINATDADKFTAQNLPNGLSIDNSGLISGTITQPADGTHNVTITATDSDANLSSSIQFTWNVADNLPPVLTAPPTQNSSEGQTITPLTIQAVDADGGFTATGLPKGLSISGDGVISGTIDARAAGTYTVTINASDGTLAAQPVNFTWNVADTTPPGFANPGTQTNNEGASVNLAIASTDADAGSFRASGLPAGLSIDPNTGRVFGAIHSPAGTYTVTVSANDGGVVGSVAFPWVVNLRPTTTVITNVQNTYVGLYQVETVTARVTDPVGQLATSGEVTFQVNGETLTAPVSGGYATATFSTPLLSFDFGILMDDLNPHPLDAVFSDPSGIFGASTASYMDAPMLLDFYLFMLAQQTKQLELTSQFQVL